jgi:hypothetical protein
MLLASLTINLPRLVTGVIFQDDFQILTESWPWSVTQANLWFAHNEHVMPVGRIAAWAMVEFTPRLTWLPVVTCSQGPIAVLLGMILTYLFVSRERNHPFHGLMAMLIFGVTSQYHQAVWWFSASYSIVALDTILLGLLAAQAWRRTKRWYYLALTIVAVAVAPTWFAIGILAGPLCTLYLLLPRPDRPGWRPRIDWGLPNWTPLLGTVLFLAISLPLTSHQVMHLEHYGNKTALEAFNPRQGALFTLRALTDNVVLGLIGVPAVPLPAWLTFILAAVWVGVFVAWWRYSGHQGLMLLGAAFIVSSYLLTYSARADWTYGSVGLWTRYNLLPTLGMSLLVAGGLPDWRPSWNDVWRRRRGSTWMTLLVIVMVMLQLGRAWPAPSMKFDEMMRRLGENDSSESLWTIFSNHWNAVVESREDQQRLLRELERIDDLCRQHRISAAQAVEALPSFAIDPSGPHINGLKFLRGCNDCEPHTLEEIRRLLRPAE